MLTAKQYEAIGRMTLAFNGIEQLLDMYLPDILGNPEPSVAYLVAEKQHSATRKMDFLRELLEVICGDRPTVQAEAATVRDLLEKTKEFGRRRNEYVHSYAFIDYKARKRMLRSKKEVIECNEKDITDLATEMDDITVPLSQALHKLMTVLIKVRCAH
jgi:hypothetical protein